jgi:predicted DNA-binding protein
MEGSMVKKLKFIPTYDELSAQRSVRVDGEQYDELQVLSEKTGVPIAGIVRQALDAWLKRK